MKKNGSLQQELKMNKPFQSLEEETFLNLLRTEEQLMTPVVVFLKKQKLSPALYNILRILRGAGKSGLPCQKISERVITRVPDITRLVDRLEKSGLAERERSQEDRRIVAVKISKKGTTLLKKLDRPIEQLNQNQFTSLTKQELKTLNHLLEKIRIKR